MIQEALHILQAMGNSLCSLDHVVELRNQALAGFHPCQLGTAVKLLGIGAGTFVL